MAIADTIQDSAVGQAAAGAASIAAQAPIQEAFYWLLGTVVAGIPSSAGLISVLAVIGMDILWFVASRIRAKLFLWQKVAIIALNFAALFYVFGVITLIVIIACKSPANYLVRIHEFLTNQSSLCNYTQLIK